jgi:membrane-bound lytic murein transglycosylase D
LFENIGRSLVLWRGHRAGRRSVREDFVVVSRQLIWVFVLALSACGRAGLRSVVVAPEVASERADVVAEVVLPPVIAAAAADAARAAQADVLPEGEAEEPVAAPAVEAAPEPPVTWDIEVSPYESHERVEYFVGRFTGAAKESFELALERQSRYAPMIHERLRAGGLPEDMIYLPLIESWYDPHAYSRAAAVGMWQFMTSTAKSVGLRVDWWVDERRDPVRATDGAVIFLNRLRESFGSVYLAAAAYNGGPGRVSRGLTRHASALEDAEGEAQFFALASQRNALAPRRAITCRSSSPRRSWGRIPCATT